MAKAGNTTDEHPHANVLAQHTTIRQQSRPQISSHGRGGRLWRRSVQFARAQCRQIITTLARSPRRNRKLKATRTRRPQSRRSDSRDQSARRKPAASTEPPTPAPRAPRVCRVRAHRASLARQARLPAASLRRANCRRGLRRPFRGDCRIKPWLPPGLTGVDAARLAIECDAAGRGLSGPGDGELVAVELEEVVAGVY